MVCAQGVCLPAQLPRWEDVHNTQQELHNTQDVLHGRNTRHSTRPELHNTQVVLHESKPLYIIHKLYYRVAIQDCKSRECAQVPRWQDVNNATQFASVTKAGCRFWRFHAFWGFTVISNDTGCLLGLCVPKFLIEIWDYLPCSLYLSALVYVHCTLYIVQRGSGGARADVWMSSKDKHWFKSDQVQQRYTGHTWVTGQDW